MKSKLTAKIFYLLLAIGIFSTVAVAQRGELSGKWNLTALKSSGETIDISLTGRGSEKLGIDFSEKERFDLITPCNAAGGSFTADTGGNFKAGDIFSTKMFCGDERMKVETAMTGAMQAATKYSFEDGDLILRDESGANVLKFSRSGKANPTAEAKEITLYIAPEQANCMTVAPTKCFRAKEKPDG
jgi:heat shock protein HslJ